MRSIHALHSRALSTSGFRRASAVLAALAATIALVGQTTLAGGPPPKADGGLQNALDQLNERARAYGLANHAPPSDPSGYFAENFEVLGHNSLGRRDSSGDVWVHGDFAYIGTWGGPCTGRGVKIVDVSDLNAPRVIGSLAARQGTSAEDMVVRHVETDFFVGDLLAVGIQRCGQAGGPFATYGAEFWDVTDPYHPNRLSVLGVTNGGGGVHELDLIQRGDNVYAALATPFSEWFDPVPEGDFRLVDATDPRNPLQVSEWGAGDELGWPGPFYGQGSFGASFDHSARFNADGSQVYVSYWDLGVLTFDISDVTNPVLTGQTQFAADADGDVHSVSEYGDFLLTNDEDFDPRSPAHILFGVSGMGVASESPFNPPLWDEPGHAISGDVFLAANQGCATSDYPGDAAGKIAVLHTEFAFFGVGADPQCSLFEQDAAADAEGVAAIVHAFDSPDTSPQWFDFSEAGVPVLYTDPTTAADMVAEGSATLEAQLPSWGYLRVFDKATGLEVAHFDDVFGINDLSVAGDGFWSIHNNEVMGDRSYVSWYTNGVIALDLSPLNLNPPQAPVQVGQFIPAGFAEVWGVAIRDDGVIFVSDLGSGLWIIRPTGDAAP